MHPRVHIVREVLPLLGVVLEVFIVQHALIVDVERENATNPTIFLPQSILPIEELYLPFLDKEETHLHLEGDRGVSS